MNALWVSGQKPLISQDIATAEEIADLVIAMRYFYSPVLLIVALS